MNNHFVLFNTEENSSLSMTCLRSQVLDLVAVATKRRGGWSHSITVIPSLMVAKKQGFPMPPCSQVANCSADLNEACLFLSDRGCIGS